MSIRIDAEEMAEAIQNSDSEIQHYLDKETGEVLILMPKGYRSEDDDTPARLRSSRRRYIKIEPIPSRDAFEMMHDFVRDLSEGRDRDRLRKALERGKPFRNFKDALADMPEVEAAWFQYKDEEIDWYARRWLHIEGIEAELGRRARPSSK